MRDNGFKEFIESRTVDEIMADYSEQRDEWETLIVVEKDEIVRFRHCNGRTFFCEQYNPENKEYIVNDKVLEVLSGKTIEQQMEYFYVTESYRFFSTAYDEITKDDLRKNAVKLSDYDGVKKLLLKNKVLIGAKIEAYSGEGILLPESPVCTYYACDNEGSGTKEREDYAYLIICNLE